MNRDFADAVNAYDDSMRRSDAPKPQPCHKCTHLFAGAVCPICKEERPAYADLKKAIKAAREVC